MAKQKSNTLKSQLQMKTQLNFALHFHYLHIPSSMALTSTY